MQNKCLSPLNCIICNRTVNSNFNTYMKEKGGCVPVVPLQPEMAFWNNRHSILKRNCSNPIFYSDVANIEWDPYNYLIPSHV